MADSSQLRHVRPTRLRTTVHQALLTGVALTIPLFVTLLVIGFLVNTLSNVLDPVVGFAFQLSGSSLKPAETPAYLVKVVAVVVLVLAIFCIGFVAERRSGPGRIESMFDATMERIPGVGSIYTSFDEMSQMLLDSDTQSFQEVVLVEHPTADAYTIAFVTASTPDSIERATGHEEMVTLFMPMAPNPVMGGHVVHVPAGHVHDVEMTVEEGLRSIVTSGVTIGESGVRAPLDGTDAGTGTGYPQGSPYGDGRCQHEPLGRTGAIDRESAYMAAADPEHADTPDAVARTECDDGIGAEADRPDNIDRQSGTVGDDTGRPGAFDRSDGTVGSETGTPSDIESGHEEQN